jgi:hypothetical protein
MSNGEWRMQNEEARRATEAILDCAFAIRHSTLNPSLLNPFLLAPSPKRLNSGHRRETGHPASAADSSHLTAFQ